jgi:hypothetical protein
VDGGAVHHGPHPAGTQYSFPRSRPARTTRAATADPKRPVSRHECRPPSTKPGRRPRRSTCATSAAGEAPARRAHHRVACADTPVSGLLLPPAPPITRPRPAVKGVTAPPPKAFRSPLAAHLFTPVDNWHLR